LAPSASASPKLAKRSCDAHDLGFPEDLMTPTAG
jgi:hypothetical protein